MWAQRLLFMLGACVAVIAEATANDAAVGRKKPNFVIFLADDLGYGDVGVYGAPTIPTPNIDALARTGLQFKQYYASASVCTPSRGGLMTGRDPHMTGLYGKNPMFRVFYPWSTGGLKPSDTTIAEALGTEGYSSMLVGKWHLGHKTSLPTKRGFDHFYGIPYSHDMSSGGYGMPSMPLTNRINPHLPLYVNDTIVEQPVPIMTLTPRLTQAAVSFIERSAAADKPFLLIFSYYQPHHPNAPRPEFQGLTPRGPYGDFVAELDGSIGEVMHAIEQAGLRDNTLVHFTSDNGPWTIKATEGGSTGGLRGSKGETWEGGYRVPGIFSWPGRVAQAQTTFAVASQLDLFDTLLKLARGQDTGTSQAGHADSGGVVHEWPQRDGISLADVLLSDSEQHRREQTRNRTIIYTFLDKIMAIRRGQYKVHFFTHKTYVMEPPTHRDPPLVYNIEHDPFENSALTNQTLPEFDAVVREFKALYEHYNARRRWPSLLEDRHIFAAPCCELGDINNPCVCRPAEDSELPAVANPFSWSNVQPPPDVRVPFQVDMPDEEPLTDDERQQLLLSDDVVAQVMSAAPASLKPLLRSLFPDVCGRLSDEEIARIKERIKEKLREAAPPCDDDL